MEIPTGDDIRYQTSDIRYQTETHQLRVTMSTPSVVQE